MLAFKQAKVYVRVGLMAVVVLAIALVLFKNRANRVSFWFFGLTDELEQTNVVWVVLSVSAATRVCGWVWSLTRGLWKDYQSLRQHRMIESAEKLQSQRVAELDEREKRLDQKSHQALSQEENGEE